jgi:LysM repeat protein
VSRSFRLGLSLFLAVLALGWITSGTAASPPDQGPVIHVVKAGEALSSIAAQYGVSLDAIIQTNKLKDPEYIFAGQRLIIPNATAPAVTQAVASPTAQVVAPTIAAVVATPAPAVATPAPAAASTSDVYTVRSNDTLGDIAMRYSTTVDAIAEANGISPLRDIYIGQKLHIPGAVIQPDQPPANVLASAPDTGGATGTPTTYVVQPGDTLSLIALRYGTSYQDLAAANGLSGSGFIYAGQTLIVPATTSTAAARPAPVRAARPPTSAGSYTVQPGDTLSGIANKLGIDMAVLARFNAIPRPSLIVPGQTFTIPRVAAPGTPPWGEKKIEIDVSMQHMFVWEGDVLVKHFTVSTGLSGFQTRRGTFHVKSKVPVAYSTAYDLYMPSWLGIYDVGNYENGIHSLPTKGATGRQLWAGVLGSPVSFGCVVMGVEDGKWLYDWAELGTLVEIKD